MAHGARRVWQNLLDMLRKFFTGALRAGAVLGATVVVSAQLLACPAPAGATGPAVPTGTSRAALARPSVYPGGGVYPFGDAEVGAPKVASVNGAGPTFNSLVSELKVGPAPLTEATAGRPPRRRRRVHAVGVDVGSGQRAPRGCRGGPQARWRRPVRGRPGAARHYDRGPEHRTGADGRP